MPIAGAVVVPLNKKVEGRLVEKLKEVPYVDVKDIGPKGIAVVLEAESAQKLKDISEEINRWEEVIEFELVYLNWEDEDEEKRDTT